MSSLISRRSFLKAGLITAGTAATAGTGLASAVRAAAGPKTELCTLLDLNKCIGCEECVHACREINGHKFPEPEGPPPIMRPVERVKTADWSSPEKRAVTDRLTPYNWLFIQRARGEYQGQSFELNIPRRCMHCHNAPCSKLCPFGAAYQLRNGIVRIHPDVCMGGAKCKTICPWNIPERQSGVGLHLDLLPQYAGNGVMYKCDRCYDRVAEGRLPACIEVCPESVQEIGPRNEIVQKARDLAEKTGGFIYGLAENGGTHTIYVSPVPFDVLNQALRKGPGQPQLQPVEDVMADANRWIGALAIAPAAGVIGALARFKQTAGQTQKKEDKPS
ncbi:MAG: 4Fe-4S dicluster domain-containing protein [Desulfobacterales bacterium]|jgi:Fe-S-cluster-containing dehydrogenase component|nr:4Fe-4S dicluster domain-containing protein [Desulfobacterales bacterium]MDD3080757.1 4Fe-4S dicluster domain-containing protein [Desulfobacterales bacterium]MDD3949577.1 4Fe-4S dicluster domain-containing protein [Desulfobacterales bacterium]MDD4464856.1 4Fe-4S dicluster domain-containing protein [Desulfobacterales bacterium]MDY0377134.1 4Fe-4S dicluster domain-containing protein [Desulfobacterales bacterium]